MTTTTTRSHWSLSTAPLLAAGLMALAACSSNGSTASAAGTGPAVTSGTVQVAKGGGTLETAGGRTLYVSDLERHQVLCTSGACTAVWSPLTVRRHDRPTGPGKVQGELSTVRRPDGSRQVTYDGRPLYTFSFDHGAGQVHGDGVSDSFDGHRFTWHAATAPGARTGGTAPSSSSRGGYGY